MAILTNNFEGGTNGNTVTVGNSYVGGDTFSVVTAGMEYSNARSAHGSISAKVDNSGTAVQYVKYDFDTTTVFARTYVWLDTIPTGGASVLFFGAGANTVAALVLGGGSEGRLQMYCSGSQGSSPTDKLFPTGQWVRVEMYAKSGSGTGELRLAMYSADSTTPIWDSGLQTGKTVAGGGNFTSALTGKYESTANTGTRYVDDFGVKTGSDAGWVPWPQVNVAPVVTAGAPQTLAPAATATVGFTATDSDGTIASRSTSFDFPATGAPTLTGGGTASPSFTAGDAGSLYLVRQTATDNGGGQGYAVAEVRVPVASTSPARPVGVTPKGVGSWTNVGGKPTEGESLADESDTTYVESGTLTSTEVKRRWRLAPMTVRSDLTIKPRLWAAGGSSASVTVRLFEGDVVRQQWTQAVTATPTEYSFALTTPGAIGDWGDLWVEVGAVA